MRMGRNLNRQGAEVAKGRKAGTMRLWTFLREVTEATKGLARWALANLFCIGFENEWLEHPSFSSFAFDSKPPHGFLPCGHVAFAPVQTTYKPSVLL
jgi:hypothetical protein